MEPNAAAFVFAIMFVGAGFFSLVVGSNLLVSDFRINVTFLVIMYLFHTFGELCLSPVGLSIVSRLSIPVLLG